ncbi:DMT family transporter [Cerasicoccus fimbriatus]|uniref:DMT family transporter n=1 Tax=Cerasicoccus fimbriatus TaxID=3014554 RepID=UPI0022B379F7|nr:DMT family transporter [Cerasicoccus sp. TK19100]
MVILILGVFCCSTAVIFIKASTTNVLWLSALRLLIASAIIAPLWLRDARQTKMPPGLWRMTFWPALFLGLHMISWLYGARITPAAQSTLIVNLAPLASPFFLFFMVGEKVSRREIAGTLVALVGVLILFGDDLFDTDGPLLGNVVCFGSMLLFCVYLVIARQLREKSTLWTYLGPLYLMAGLICVPPALIWAPLPDVGGWDFKEWAMVLGLAVVPTVFGHSVLNFAMRHLRGQLVTTANTAQCIFAAVMAYCLFGEEPDWAFYVAATFILAGILMNILGKRQAG